MSYPAVAAVQARVASIEARFHRSRDTGAALGSGLVDPPAGATGTAAAATGAPPVAGVPRPTFADALDGAIARTMGGVPSSTATIPPVTIPQVELAGVGQVATSAPAAATHGGYAGPVAPGTPFAANFEAEGAEHGVPPRLLAAVGWVESRYTVDAVSSAGAIGVMQIMPMTAHELGVDPWNPDQAIDGAARLLAEHHDRFGSWDLALAAYHSGAGAVSRAGNTAPPRAAEYVRLVTARMEQT